MQASRRLYTVVPVALACITNLGCSLSRSQTSMAVNAQIKGTLRFEFKQLRSQDPACTRSRHNYAELSVAVRDHDEVILDQVIGRQNGTALEDENPFGLGSVEGRIDADRARIWLVDKGQQRVIASIDLRTDRVTGISDKAPEWATLSKGTVFLVLPEAATWYGVFISEAQDQA